ncbi:MAG: hypothetical protein NC393_13320 [Clostridium sp.]|nr:hypothetical protein [Clostridium sp.]MCM1173091.1 hypothetical protein [Clostridium sp.]MCM1208090.1 hypothetical protein [Ruminococcus sp.]
MKLYLNNNQMPATELVFSAEGKLPEVAVLKNVKFTYETDSDGKHTEKIIAIRYECVDPETFASFTIKVNGGKAVITPEQLEETEELVYIEIPVKDTLIKPYAIEYGMAKVSIIAPYIKLHKE